VEYQRLLLDHLDLIDQIVRTTARRRHLSGVEQEDFASFVSLRLVEDDYAILRKFQNRSSLWTYLAAVIERMSLDFCVERWGRWRPSAMAERLGSVAVVLERLVSRDGHTLEEAIEIIRAHHAVGVSVSELRAIWDQLPVRGKTTEVGEEAAATVRSNDSSDAGIEDAHRQQDIERLERALQAAFEGIAKQDRVIIALRFDENLSVAQIAKVTNSSVPTVHRRLDKSLKHLRKSLVEAGFAPAEISRMIGHPSIALSPMLRAEVERISGPVRLSKRDG
jgi:RNA polymerase sigma factor for flagellar operon FliA